MSGSRKRDVRLDSASSTDKVPISVPPPSRKSQAERRHSRDEQTQAAADGKQCVKPKFIPHEPYKAAVGPFVPDDLSGLPNQYELKPASPVGLADKHAIKRVVGGKEMAPERVATVIPVLLSRLTMGCDRKSSKPDDTTLDADQVAILKAEIDRLRTDNQNLDAQLKLQIQVNTELKKLLVASVGEDLETRVEFLTHDKVKLAHDVHQYVQRLMADHEEKEKLSIQCDVWRSKFLASSLVVDELANWKAVIYRRYDDALESLETLLNERRECREQLLSSYSCLKSTRDAFEPGGKRQTNHPGTILELSTAICTISKALYLRLLGMSYDAQTATDSNPLTPGEQRAEQVLSVLYRPPRDRLARANIISGGVSSLHSGLVHRFHPNTRFEHLTMNCCAHCKGEMQLL